MQKVPIVFCSTNAVRNQLVTSGLIAADRLVQAPYGTSIEFSPEPVEPDPAALQLGLLDGRDFLLHVGSCIPRKRIDVLLDTFAAIHTHHPDLRLVKVGGEWSKSQIKQIDALKIAPYLHHFQGLTRSQLASLYRRAKLVLITSESEGFGLPAIEALACGAPVLASNIAPLCEAGGDAVLYAPVGDVTSWVEIVHDILSERLLPPVVGTRIAQSAKYSWRNHASIIARAYARLDRS
jgi:glycosyltransferase involved in cell wall biosynthesis